MKRHKIIILALVICLMGLGASWPSSAAESDYVFAVYFTGIGCPHCANADPFVLGKLPEEYPGLIIAEYEVYQEPGNAQLLYSYNSEYNSGLSIPSLVFGRDNHLMGDSSISQGAGEAIGKSAKDDFPMIGGTGASFGELDIASLPGRPKFWTGERILISGDNPADGKLLKALLAADLSDLDSVLEGAKYRVIKPKPALLSGGSISFDNAVEIGPFASADGENWILEWNGPALKQEAAETEALPSGAEESPGQPAGKESVEQTSSPANGKEGLTLAKIVSLAAVDAINPCALAVLAMMLIAIFAYNPKNRKNIILSGLAFVASVFLMYLVYGLVIIRFFQLVQSMVFVRLWLYKALGGAAVILGALNIRDFARYRPGRMGTEMPMFLRPKVKRIISGVTSPRGAFVVGVFVTVFLLPCTIGPYIICGGILCSLDFVQTLPWLLLYNLIFVLPMVFITFLVYFGVAKAEEVSGWKERNIRYLHLAAGAIILVLGLAMLLGWT